MFSDSLDWICHKTSNQLKTLWGTPLLLLAISSTAQTTRCTTDFDSTLINPNAVIIAEVMPSYKEGYESLTTYLNNYVSPHCQGMGNSGITFIVDTLGSIKNICIKSDINRKSLTEKEKMIITAIKKMPDWIPGSSDGRKVPVQVSIPIKEKY